MKTLVILTLSMFFCLIAEAAVIQIVCAAPPDSAEYFAASELKTFLEQTGNNLPPISSSSSSDKNIRNFIIESVQSDRRNTSEEWIITSLPNGDVVFAGKSPRAVLYGVYDFLERIIGVRFLAVDTTSVPRCDLNKLPGQIRLRGKPYFQVRDIIMGYYSDAVSLFCVRNKINAKGNSRRYGFAVSPGSPGMCHTSHEYSMCFPQRREEYFSLCESGTRRVSVNREGPGQLCLSNHEMRKHCTAIMADFIARDREKIRQSRSDAPFPAFYVLDLNDNFDFCVCANCNASIKKYGTRAGLLLEFINEIAGKTAKNYPDVTIITNAYQITEALPDGITPAENVMIRLAMIGPEYKGQCDTIRGLNHTNNAASLKLLADWSKQSKKIGIWAYWVLYREPFLTPYTKTAAMGEDFKIYAKNKVQYVLGESELYFHDEPHFASFSDLRIYMGAKLMQDPQQNAQKLVEDFFARYYGRAAQTMRRYYDYLIKRMNEEQNIIQCSVPGTRKYLDRDFFDTADAMLDQAILDAGNNPDLLKRINQERLAVDSAILHLDNRIQSRIPRLQRLARYRANMLAALEKYDFESKRTEIRKKTLDKIDAMTNVFPLPDFLHDRVVHDFPWHELNVTYLAKLVDDPNATGGKSILLPDDTPRYKKIHQGKSPEFGIYNYDDKKTLLLKKLAPSEIPQDEKYHFIHIGRARLTPKSRFWGNWTWGIQQPILPFDTLRPDMEYDIYASVKFTGPAFVKGSIKPNAIYHDRLIIAECRQKQ